MNKVKTSNFRFFIGALSALVTECRIHVTETEMSVKAVDTANVGMIIISLPIEGFSPRTFCIDICKLKYILQNEDSETLYLDFFKKGDSEYLGIQGGDTWYFIKLYEDASVRKDPNPPTITLPWSFVTDGQKLTGAIKKCTVVSDKVVFRIKKGKFYFLAKGDQDKIIVDIIPTIQGDDDAFSIFSLDYLKDFAQIFEQSLSVIVDMGHEHPATFTLTKERVTVQYLLAPRLIADEERVEDVVE